MTDTPESVRALIAGYAGYRGVIDWGPMIDVLTRYAASLERDNARIRELEKENNYLRASMANSGGPCVYCLLSREDWIKCRDGFPGCSRIDDAMLCPHVGAEIESQGRIRELEAKLSRVQVAGEVGVRGTVRDVYDAPQGYILEVETPTGRPLVPLVPELLESVDEATRTLVFVSLPGLLD